MNKTILFIFVLFFLLLNLFSVKGDITDNMVGYYSVNDGDISGTNFFDLESYDPNATNTGTTTSQVGILNESVRFDTNTDIITVSDNANQDIDFDNGIWTVNLWANCTDGSQQSTFIARQRTGSDYFAFRFVAGGELYVYMSDGTNYANAYVNADVRASFCDSSYHMLTMRRNMSNVCDGANMWQVFIDSSMQTMTSSSDNGASCPLEDTDFYFGWYNDNTFTWVGNMDEMSIYKGVALDQSEINELYNSGSAYNPFAGEVNDTDVTPPSITNVNQYPTNLTVLNALTDSVKVNATITDNIQLNLTSIVLNLNTTGIYHCILGVCTNVDNTVISYNDTANNNYNFYIEEDDYLSMTENLNHDLFEVTNLSNNTLSTANQWLKIQFYNISNDADLVFSEIMDSNTSDVAEYYYCNENYTTGNPLGDSDCTKFHTQSGNDSIHPHRGNTWHRVMLMGINESGYLNDVYVTPLSFILKRGSVDGELYYYLPTDTNTSWTTNNNGNAWTEQDYTVNAHIHMINSTDQIFYNICAQDNSSNLACSILYNDTIDFPLLPPIPVKIDTPEFELEYNESITIEYKASYSLTGQTITGYLIEYKINTSSNWVELIDNNYPDLTYNWDISDRANGGYNIRITVTDSLGYHAITVSDIFIIANAESLNTQLLTSIDAHLETIENTMVRRGDIMIIFPFIPLLIGLLLLVGSAVLGEEHIPMRIFLFVTAFLTPIISLQYGIQIINYYNSEFSEILGNIGVHSTILATVFFIVFVYFTLYSAVKIINSMAKNKADRLRY